MRARLGMYFYVAVALTSLALFALQLALRFPGYPRFQSQQPTLSSNPITPALSPSPHPKPLAPTLSPNP